ncbi:SLOG family protein [Sphingobium sp.]|uniref:SLOG family protein n=1 Tax=Sphingobium sp. TaxID=1912891 RepID=UPI002BD7B0B7|nr:SLOG family protein [Sphingobium sp.]HUD92515.1 SLOG family protein [Sphingobium sp.]
MIRKRPASVERFTDLKTLYAEAIATPEFQTVFGDPMPLSIIEPGDEPGEHDMPEPIAAQAECGGIVAAIFDLFTGTRLEPFAPEIAWGIVNSFHFAAGKIERREDAIAQELGDLARRPDLSEVYSNELEEKQLACRSLAEQRDAIECMRDYAAEMYRALSGWPWSPAKGSRASSVSIASQIAVQDFLRERQLVARERHLPQGPIVIFSGPAQWENWQPVWDRLDQIKARLPHMTLVTTGQRKGADAIAAAWAARPGNGVPLVAYGLYGAGKKVAFNRNRKLVELKPVEALLCEGSGLQANLYQLLRKASVPIHAFRKGEAEIPAGALRRPGAVQSLACAA